MIGLGLEETLLQYLRAVGWSVTAAVGFAFGVGIALKVFDYLSTDIDEWEEIKKHVSDYQSSNYSKLFLLNKI